MNILIGGVPFGRNNIGDEAILASVVRIVREAAPGAILTVSTDDPKTAQRLGVQVCPLFGFDVVPYSETEMRKVFSRNDVYLWAGATGLSDYPDRACELLAMARNCRCRRVIWNVGMNSELNPAKYRLRGKRLAAARWADTCTGGVFQIRNKLEAHLETTARSLLRSELEGCELIVTRDPESARELVRCGVPEGSVVVGADSALIQETAAWPPPVLSREDVGRLEQPGVQRVALCVSAQREITRWDELVRTLDRILERRGVELIGLPMNPITDLALLEKLKADLERPESFQILRGVTEPEDVTAVAARMDVIISSRLHLLILGSIHHVPLIGISRGSKVDNFLAPFGLESVGSVEACDFDALVRETFRLLEQRGAFEARSRGVRDALLHRLDTARSRLAEVLTKR